eukprot:TRINITY_DN4816_c0_g1_i1.p1 TRINITY_DN4816_c0_g1~~TRINITY_DN4816_c0_g1_i1.p1  ORF type:complete len:448 (+),score=141.62 TRINITY_DN4816_c0_g1_i1:63-1406(+)
MCIRDSINAEYMGLQLEYLEKLLQERERGVRFGDDLLLLHVQLLAQLKPKSLVKEVERYNYPLQECLRVCDSLGAIEGEAHFLEKIGDFSRAIDLHLKLFEIKLGKTVERVEFGEPLKDERLHARVRRAAEICRRGDKEESERLWFHLLDQVLRINHKIVAKYRDDELFKGLLTVLADIVGGVFDQMTKQIDILVVLDHLDKAEGLVYGELKRSLEAMLNKNKFVSTMLKSLEVLLGRDSLLLQERLNVEMKRGCLVDKILSGRCHYCQGTVWGSREPLVWFFSQDISHRRCFEDSEGVIPITDDDNFHLLSLIHNTKKRQAALRERKALGEKRRTEPPRHKKSSFFQGKADEDNYQIQMIRARTFTNNRLLELTSVYTEYEQLDAELYYEDELRSESSSFEFYRKIESRGARGVGKGRGSDDDVGSGRIGRATKPIASGVKKFEFI